MKYSHESVLKGVNRWLKFTHLLTGIVFRQSHDVIVVLQLILSVALLLAFFITATAPILKFGNGEVYKYQFEGSTTTHLSGAKGNPVKLGVSATAEISALPQCTYSLKLTKVVVANADDKVRKFIFLPNDL